MLALMSYNFGIFVSFVLGHFVGYLMFSLRSTMPKEEEVEKKMD